MDKVKVFYVILVLIVINNSTEVSADTNCGIVESSKWKLPLWSKFLNSSAHQLNLRHVYVYWESKKMVT